MEFVRSILRKNKKRLTRNSDIEEFLSIHLSRFSFYFKILKLGTLQDKINYGRINWYGHMNKIEEMRLHRQVSEQRLK